jgi:hypothetical protein
MQTTFSSSELNSIDLSAKAEAISICKSIWATTKVAAHTWFGLGMNLHLHYLPKAVNENIYGMQIEIIKADIRDRLLSSQKDLKAMLQESGFINE